MINPSRAVRRMPVQAVAVETRMPSTQRDITMAKMPARAVEKFLVIIFLPLLK